MEKAIKTRATGRGDVQTPKDWSSFGQIGRDIEVATGEISNASSAQFVLIPAC